MDGESIGIEAARAAVRRLVERMIAENGMGVEPGVVVDEAVRILEEDEAGELTLLRAAEAVKVAILSMERGG